MVAWKIPIGSGYSGLAVAGGKIVTQYTDGESDVMAAFDVAAGRKLWSYAFGEAYAGHDGSHDGPVATPLIAGGRVFGLGPRGRFFALDVETGREIWKTHLGDDHEIKKPHYGYGVVELAQPYGRGLRDALSALATPSGTSGTSGSPASDAWSGIVCPLGTRGRRIAPVGSYRKNEDRNLTR